MKEIILVGAVHGVSVSNAYGTVHHEVEAPGDLLQKIGAGDDASVAVELYPGGETEYVGEEQWFDEPNPMFDSFGRYPRADVRGAQYLFRDLGARLLAAGNAIFPLDSKELDEVIVTHARRLESIYSRRDIDDPYLSPKQNRRAGHSRALLNFINSTLREDVMFANLAACSPDVIVIGQAHAERLATDLEIQEHAGLRITAQYQIKPDISGAQHDWESQILSSYILPVSAGELAQTALPNAVIRELHARTHNAFSIGRVLGRDAPKPDYLGRFNIVGDAAESLFELRTTVRSGEYFRGTIKDVLGDASVAGTMSDSKIAFTKTYDDTMRQPDTDFTTLHYHGEFNAQTGQYVGRYGATPDSFGPIFTMRSFSPNAARELNQSRR